MPERLRHYIQFCTIILMILVLCLQLQGQGFFINPIDDDPITEINSELANIGFNRNSLQRRIGSSGEIFAPSEAEVLVVTRTAQAYDRIEIGVGNSIIVYDGVKAKIEAGTRLRGGATIGHVVGVRYPAAIYYFLTRSRNALQSACSNEGVLRIKAAEGTAISASAEGEVVDVGYDSEYGLYKKLNIQDQ